MAAMAVKWRSMPAPLLHALALAPCVFAAACIRASTSACTPNPPPANRVRGEGMYTRSAGQSHEGRGDVHSERGPIARGARGYTLGARDLRSDG
eukprot:348231-Prorocentrum_minimum.AAC.1